MKKATKAYAIQIARFNRGEVSEILPRTHMSWRDNLFSRFSSKMVTESVVRNSETFRMRVKIMNKFCIRHFKAPRYYCSRQLSRAVKRIQKVKSYANNAWGPVFALFYIMRVICVSVSAGV